MRLNSKLTKQLNTLIETLPAKELAIGYLEYKILSKMTPAEFTALYKERLVGKKFDERVIKTGALQ